MVRLLLMISSERVSATLWWISLRKDRDFFLEEMSYLRDCCRDIGEFPCRGIAASLLGNCPADVVSRRNVCPLVQP